MSQNINNVQHNHVSNLGRISNAAVSAVTGQEDVLHLVHQYVLKHRLQTNWEGGERQERKGEENGGIIFHVGNPLP